MTVPALLASGARVLFGRAPVTITRVSSAGSGRVTLTARTATDGLLVRTVPIDRRYVLV